MKYPDYNQKLKADKAKLLHPRRNRKRTPQIKPSPLGAMVFWAIILLAGAFLCTGMAIFLLH